MEQKDATCTENGYSISACQTCNDKKKEEIVAKGHSKGIRNKKLQPAKRKDIREIPIAVFVRPF